MSPQEIVSRLLYRDGLMLIINKPAGLAVHRGPKGGASLEDYFDALRFGLPRAPALAHRLDRDTSGCLVLGRHRKALAELGRLFKNGKVAKCYWAVVEGGPAADEGRIDIPLGRLDESRGWWMKPDPHGQPAATEWRVLGRSCFTSPWSGEVDAVAPSASAAGGGEAEGTPPRIAARSDPPPPGEGKGGAGSARDKPLTWLALTPLTGRTHQLRVHCAEMGWPIVGDAIYGHAPRSGGPTLHLQAREIVVPLYKNREPVRVVAPVPAHMRQPLASCGWINEPAEAAQ